VGWRGRVGILVAFGNIWAIFMGYLDDFYGVFEIFLVGYYLCSVHWVLLKVQCW